MIRRFLYTFYFSLIAFTVQAQVKPVQDTSIHISDTLPKKAVLKPIQDTSHRRLDSLAQKKPALKPQSPKDSIYTTSGGLRLGLDISRFTLLYFQPYRTDVTIQADAQLNKKLYGAVEIGVNRTSHSDTNYTYKGRGEFITIGVDYDFLNKKDPQEKNMVYGGIRYGFAHNSYEVPAYNIHDSYWESDQPGTYPKTSITAHWVELVLGMRVEAFKNFFLGWGVREKIMLSNSASKEFPPLIIPGFGNGVKRSQFDMTYTVAYYIPLYKVKIHVPRTVPKKK